mmetsp:Transcript_5179/g.7996  ORF Transcript_5179/g.7996 Transcript_5179/m.7996 type:complete len:84 (+) Transcript_5179:889-1140(+)
MQKWRNFVNDKPGSAWPGPILNKSLKNDIKKARAKMNFPEDESELGMEEKKEYYSLTVNFFRFFFNLYDCDEIVIIKFKNKQV